ncbi:LysR substrate-binding domain-containing protein [Variovorax sp. PCZ-1]|uniref:LysR substrate-binding domain-containing protein n=1 Tax=Variovorax sp. PCZ-1 TaxID=2835533 RepID=UPI001BD183A6|nr:LysR substrate-binding domain-containing protein [Variovorax sp. PCZ-1]MBS7806656.1 LysR family transcriptional regulator [Variovorax sp. PCZ-1]
MNRHLQRLLRTTPQQLRAFEATARLLSVTKAAEELHVSQPTVSVQLKELAAAVGTPLFDTVGRRIQLTAGGQALLETVSEVVGCWQRFESTLSDMQGLVRGRLKIAAVTTAEYFVPDLLGPFAAAHPGVDIDLAVENRDRVVERLEKHSDDLAVMMLPPAHLPLDALPFMANPLVVIAASSHPRAGKRSQLAQLQQERWLMRESGSGTRTVALQHFMAHDFEPRIAMSLGSNEALKHAVASHLGISVISRMAFTGSAAHAGLVELKVSGFPLQRQWQVAWRKDYPLSAAARTFVKYLQSRPSLS